jgi:hypothetical protein
VYSEAFDESCSFNDAKSRYSLQEPRLNKCIRGATTIDSKNQFLSLKLAGI